MDRVWCSGKKCTSTSDGPGASPVGAGPHTLRSSTYPKLEGTAIPRRLPLLLPSFLPPPLKSSSTFSYRDCYSRHPITSTSTHLQPPPPLLATSVPFALLYPTITTTVIVTSKPPPPLLLLSPSSPPLPSGSPALSPPLPKPKPLRDHDTI